jgi:hypothetical protein
VEETLLAGGSAGQPVPSALLLAHSEFAFSIGTRNRLSALNLKIRRRHHFARLKLTGFWSLV